MEVNIQWSLAMILHFAVGLQQQNPGWRDARVSFKFTGLTLVESDWNNGPFQTFPTFKIR